MEHVLLWAGVVANVVAGTACFVSEDFKGAGFCAGILVLAAAVARYLGY